MKAGYNLCNIEKNQHIETHRIAAVNELNSVSP